MGVAKNRIGASLRAQPHARHVVFRDAVERRVGERLSGLQIDRLNPGEQRLRTAEACGRDARRDAGRRRRRDDDEGKRAQMEPGGQCLSASERPIRKTARMVPSIAAARIGTPAPLCQ